MKKTLRSNHHSLTELNITPLLDLVFVLLVIFIITTPQMMNNLEMTLPSANVPPPKPNEIKPRLQRISVEADGSTRLNGEPIAVPALREELRRLKAADSELRVVVKSDDEADYQALVAVLDVLRQLDISRVGLATQAN
ncbi:MAG: biopolymer transporter ExbD [Verrucomicrobiota bacterium]